MILKISDRDKFLNNFLSPISKVTDSAALKVTPGKVTSLLSTSDNNIIVHAEFTDSNINASKDLNIPDIKKLCRIISCIDATSFDLDISSNCIAYKSDSVRFKYHLYDDGIIPTPKLNIDKLKALDFDGKFTLPYSSIINLVKGSVITTDTNKLYLSVKDKQIFGELTDRARPNVDSYGIQIADDYEGIQFANPIPLNFEIIRIVSIMKFKAINAQLVSKMGVLLFDLNLDSTSLKFVISALLN